MKKRQEQSSASVWHERDKQVLLTVLKMFLWDFRAV